MLNIEQVAARYKVDRSTIWRWRKSGKFPKPIDTSEGVRWDENLLDELDSFQNKMNDIIKSKMNSQRACDFFPDIKSKPHREICALCHEVSRVGFWVPSEIWAAAIHPYYQNSIICLRCFTRLADEKSVEWDKEIKFFPVSWITHTTLIRNMNEAFAAPERSPSGG